MVPQWGTHQTVHLPNMLPQHDYLKVRLTDFISPKTYCAKPFVQTRCMLRFSTGSQASVWLAYVWVQMLSVVFPFVGNGTVRLGSHSAQRTTSTFPARRYNTR